MTNILLPKIAHSAVKDLADEAMSGEMSEEDENESPKERIAKVLHNIGAGNISAWWWYSRSNINWIYDRFPIRVSNQLGYYRTFNGFS